MGSRMSSILNATTSSGLQIAPDNSGSLQLQTNNGTTALTIDTSQNVGIGTASPSYKLEVRSSSDTEIGIVKTSVGTVKLGSYTGTESRLTSDPGYITFYTGSPTSERMRIDSSGNVGIGTTTLATSSSSGAVFLATNSNFNITGQTSSAQLGLGNYNNGVNATNGTLCGALAFRTFFNSTFGGGSDIASITGVYTGNGTTRTGGIAFYTINAGAESEKMRIDSSGYVQGTVNGLSAGRMQAYQYYRLNSGYAGSNATGAQSLFGVGVTLVGSTVYEFEAVIAMSKSAGTTSHTIGLGFGGTATLNNIAYELISSPIVSASFTARLETVQTIMFIQTASNTTTTSASASAAAYVTYVLKGTVSVNAGGTFIPQYTLSAAPGGAYTTAIGSYIKIAPLGASGANTNIGSWA
jgi:hypothetical protein